jgi:hypothetical protein
MIRSLLAGTIVTVLLAGSLVGFGCAEDPHDGWVWGDMHVDEVETVAVDMFTVGPGVFRRGLEMQLTEAVAKHINLNTPYRIADRREADTVLTGEISKITQSMLSNNPDSGRPREFSQTLHVSFRWLDLRTGQVRKEVRNLTVATSYVPHPPIDGNFSQTAMENMDRVAVRIVQHMEQDWHAIKGGSEQADPNAEAPGDADADPESDDNPFDADEADARI